MGAGDFTPSSSGRMKPVTKAQLRKMQENYQLAASMAEEKFEEEQKEREEWKKEMDDAMEDVFR